MVTDTQTNPQKDKDTNRPTVLPLRNTDKQYDEEYDD